MGANTKIQWTATVLPDGTMLPGYTFNPWIGCTRVSPGCANCYAAVSTPARVNGIKWGPGQPRQRTSESNWRQPEIWNRQAQKTGVRRKVFCASLADWLDPEVPPEWLDALLELIAVTPWLDWLLLTKRPELWRTRLDAAMASGRSGIGAPAWNLVTDWLDAIPPPNVWMGTTVEDQERADERLPRLLGISAVVHYLSVEPLLGHVMLPMERLAADGVNPWVILGGESGPGARPCDMDALLHVLLDCRCAGVPVFVKQLGARPVWPLEIVERGEVGQLHDPKGGDITEWPEAFRVREFPKMERSLEHAA